MDYFILNHVANRIAIRKGQYREFRNRFPNLPDYVAHDIYSNIKNMNQDMINMDQDMIDWLTELNFHKWKLETLELNLHDFCQDTAKRLKEREFGDVNPYQVPRDEERMLLQQAIVKGDGKNEPVILVKGTDNKYELLEGWHRTMNLLKMGKEGASDIQDPYTWNKVRVKAWVGKP